MSNRRLKIAYVIDDLGYGGAQRQLSVQVTALAETADPRVYCLSDITRPFAATIRAGGVRVIPIHRSHGFDLGRLSFLVGELSREKTDVVHGFLDASNVYAYLAARLSGLPCVLSLRSDAPRLAGIRGQCLRYALRSADRVVANSKAGARFLSESVSVRPQRTAVVPNAVAPSFLSGDGAEHRASVLPSPAVVGFVGRLSEAKRLDLLVDAHAALLERAPDTKLVLVGDGPERQSLIERIDRLGTADLVTMTGAVDDVAPRIREFSCLVLPSAFEGSPNVVMEALAVGVPVVARPVGDLEDVVVDGRTGFLLREDTPAALADLLSRVVTDASLRTRVGEHGPGLIRTEYSLANSTDKLTTLYAKLVADRS